MLNRFLNSQFYILFFLLVIMVHPASANIIPDKRIDKKWQDKQQELFTLGQAMFDILYKFDDEAEYQKYIAKAKVQSGSTTVISKEILTSLMDNLPPSAYQAGGSASNTTAGLATLGTNTTFVGVIGHDEIGQKYLKDMQKYGINNMMKIIESDERSGTILVLIAPDGDRTMLVYPGLSREIEPTDIDKNLISNYKIAFSEGYMWSDDVANNNAIKKLFREAKNNGVITAFTFGNYTLVDKYRSQWLELIKNVDIIFSDEQQIYSLFGTNDWQQVNEIMHKYNTIFVVTFSKNGAYIVHNYHKIFIPAPQVPKVIDTTGAGDQFAAGFLYGYLHNYSLEECGKLGATAAGYIIQQIGAKPNNALEQVIQAELTRKE